MDECELILFTGSIACTLSKCYTDEELSLMSAIFAQLGASLATILVKRELCKKNENPDNDEL